MLGTKHLTSTSGQQKLAAPGMAYWADTGPAGRVCGECVHKGYWRTLVNKAGLSTGRRRSQGCAKYLALTGEHGPGISPSLRACRYFASAAPDNTAGGAR